MPGFNLTKFKVQLKLAINRSKLLQAKKSSINQQQRRELATLLESGKVESARIRVEHVIREDYNMEAMEVLEMLCDLLLARSGLLELKHCDAAIQETVHTIIYAAARSEIKELAQCRDQLVAKFGREYGEAAAYNRMGLVNPRVVQRLAVATPDPALVTAYLKEIAKTYGVPFDDGAEQADAGALMTNTMTQALATHPGAAPIVNPAPNTLLAQQQHYATSSATGPGPSIPPLPGMHNITPKASAPPQQQSGPVFTDSVSLPSPPKGDAANLPEFDDLAKRFELLKKRG